MRVTVCFYSYFKDLAGCASAFEDLPEGSTLGDLVNRVVSRYPSLAQLRASMLLAVGLEYQRAGYSLKDGDRVSFFPPVQGG
jgi:molybdopterin converting factor small subunit